jgi:hypothetical protein
LLDVGEDSRPEPDAVSERKRVGVRGAFLRAGEDMQAAQDHLAAAVAIPAGEVEGAAGEGEVDRDADDFGERVGGRAAVE